MKRLREKLYGAQFHMTAVNRKIFGEPLMRSSSEAIGLFVLAFTVKDKKLEYLDQSFGWFVRLRVDMEFCVKENIIHFKERKPKKDKDGQPIPWADPRDAVSGQKLEMFELVAKIDKDICKWREHLAKGKSVCE